MPITQGPYLQNVSPTGITVMWHTDEPATSRVEYQRRDRLGWSAYDPPPPRSYPDHGEQSGLRQVHAVALTGLQPHRCYDYRVVSRSAQGGAATSAGAALRTAPEPDAPFRFVTYGDSLRDAPHGRVAALARGHRPDLCVGAGDMSQDAIGSYPDLFFRPAAELLRYTPWFATMGNHDSPNEGFFRYFRFPEPRYWYAFDYGCAHFTMLNTCMDYRPGSEQWLWLEDDLRRSVGARWKFVFFHHPPYCSSNCEIAGTRVLGPLFERHGVDVVFGAHATRYERSHPLTRGRYDSANGVVHVVTGGGGYDLTLSPSQHWDHIRSTAALVHAANHFLLVSVAPDEVFLQAIDEHGAVFDMAHYAKPPAESAARQPAPPALSGGAEPEAGVFVAGMAEGDARWVLPRPGWVTDERLTRGEGLSIRWQQDTPRPVCPAIRRVLCMDGKAREAAGGRAYAVTAWVRTEGVSGGVTAGFEWSGDMGFLGRVRCEPVGGTEDWTMVEAVTPALPQYVYWCRVVLSALPGSTGSAWFDGVEVREI